MHVKIYLHKLLKSAIHKSRIVSLIPVINAIINIKQLKLTQVGRALLTKGKERAAIYRMDRILGNKYYQNSNIDIYKCITDLAVGSKTRPVVLVDWSGVPNSLRTCSDGEQCILKASLAAEGRSITIYEEVHSKKKECDPKTHKNFLKKLKSILTAECRPIIVTDAGFKNPWFKAVVSLGWDYVGRVRGTICYKLPSETGFKKISTLFNLASGIAKSLGQMTLTMTNPIVTNAYIYKHKLQGRKKITKGGNVARDKDAIKHSRGYREPWLLVTSLKDTSTAAKKVVKIYKLRMTIEENIRDTKSVEYGLSMNENHTINSKRYIVWLMLSALANIIAWMVGYSAEKIKLHYDFQANTYRHKRVLSFFFLGCQIIRKKIDVPINLEEIQNIAWNVEI